jgi:two-component system cell cycle sensor histidine kinase/response regulator CckA
VLEAAGPQSALDLTAEHAAGIDLLLTDIRMPKMSGIELAERFCTLLPAVPVLLISGYHDHGELPHPLLPKPFTPSELVDAVQVVLRPGADLGEPSGPPR